MLAAVGAAVSATKDVVVTFNPQLEAEKELKNNNKNVIVSEAKQLPHSINEDDIDDADDELKEVKNEEDLDLGPQFSLKEQLEKDKDDESLRKWKELLLGSVDLSDVGESKEPEVKIESLTIVCPGRADVVLSFPFVENSKSSSLFILKEASQYRLKFTFTVSNNIVSGLKYTHVVWKTGVRVDNLKKMLGTFSPQKEPYTFETEEETTPSGIFARGSYSARTKFVDDDGKCYLDVSYYFEIQKNWPKPS